MPETVSKSTRSQTSSEGRGSMKLRISQSALASAVDRVLSVVPQKTTMPVLGQLLLQAQGGEIRLTATDLDLAISTVMDGEITTEGAITLPARRFSEIVKLLDPSADVVIEVNKSAVLIVAGRANFRIFGMDASEFPKVPGMGFKKGVSISTAQLRKVIRMTVFCVSRDETRRALTGVLWEVGGDTMTMVGTDGHRLARISVPAKLDISPALSVIVPTKALQQVLRLTGDTVEENLEAKIAEDHAIFRFEGTTLHTRLIEGPFPKYQDVIPKDNDKKVVMNRLALSEALKRVSVQSDTLTHQVRLTIRPDEVVLSARTQDVGEGEDHVIAQYGGEEMSAGYNAVYLNEILRNMETEEVLLSLGTPLNAGLVEPLEQGEEENYLCLIMPLRLVD
ncbi:MAG: DNA polymerase III subunit beta [Gemmatimonadetes bacterium]|jgi:DNA polymerase-3 subunit beta|nr:DNA polymerase III subunit beta [Gemmatimonadota bacterium]